MSAFGLDRCPHCNIALPNLLEVGKYQVPSSDRTVYLLRCKTCSMPVSVVADPWGHVVTTWPKTVTYSKDIPERARNRLIDARETLANPSPCIMCCNAAVDWMLKEKGLVEGSLYSRIDKAAEEHLITDDMKAWAHEIRLSSNIERHADVNEADPTREEAQRCLNFAEALAELLFVLPERVARGRVAKQPAEAKPKVAPPSAAEVVAAAVQSLKGVR